MEYVYAALMLHKLEKEVNEANVASVVKATGAEVNEAQVKALVASLADVNIEDAIKAAIHDYKAKHDTDNAVSV